MADMRDGSALVEIRDLHKSYGPNIQVLKGLNIQMMPGERVVVIGPSGGGKSTLLRVVMGLEQIQGGSVRFGGKPYISAKGYKTVRPNLAVAFKAALGEAIRQLGESRWFLRLRIYDFRHQFSADAKHEWGIGTGMVAAAMGHSVEDTAVQHYGRLKHGKGGLKVRPSAESIAKVRRLYPVQGPTPPALTPPTSPAPAGGGKVRLSF